MPVEDFSLAQVVQTSLISFDPECSDFSFRRSIPVGIYVDAGDDSGELGSQLAELVKKALSESGFEDAEPLGRYFGSFFQMNLCRSPVPLDGPSFNEKIESVRRNLIDRLTQFPWKDSTQVAGATVKVAVAIGTAVIILTASSASPLVIGSFVVPAKLWTIIAATGEGVTLVDEARNIFVHSKAALHALRHSEPAAEAPAAGAETPAGEPAALSDERMAEIRKEMQKINEMLRNMKKS